MSYDVIHITGLTLLSTIDNALLAGLMYPTLNLVGGHSKRRDVMTFVGILLVVFQSILVMGIGWLLTFPLLRIVAVGCLIWMAIITVKKLKPTRLEKTYLGPVRVSTSVLAYTVIGNLDNLLWLGAAVKGQRMVFVVISMLSIPLFVYISGFLVEQCRQHQWVLVLGAGMMAFAAANLMTEYNMLSIFIGIPVLAFKILFTLTVLATGFLLQRRHFGAQ